MSFFCRCCSHVDYRVTESNPAQAALTGLPSAVGKSVRQLLPSIEDELIEYVERVAVTGESVRFEIQLESVDRWFDISLSHVDLGRNPTAAVVFRDISERVRAAGEREQRERAQREFVNLVTPRAPASSFSTGSNR